MRARDARTVAQLHCDGIPTGLLSEIGVDLLTSLYIEIISSDTGFGYVIENCEGEVGGFICGVTDLKPITRKFVRRKAFSLIWFLARKLISSEVLIKVRDNIRYMTTSVRDLPAAELLSIVVIPELRGQGAASQLLRRLIDEFVIRGESQLKVLVRADFERANTFYIKHGFTYSREIRKSGQMSNIYTMELEV